jgi:hypothetical protein
MQTHTLRLPNDLPLATGAVRGCVIVKCNEQSKNVSSMIDLEGISYLE